MQGSGKNIFRLERALVRPTGRTSPLSKRISKIKNAYPSVSAYSRHLLPEKFAHARKSSKRILVTAPLLVWLGAQS
jgi:hypothetical protein